MTQGRLPKTIEQKSLQNTLRNDRLKEGITYDLITIVPKPEVYLSDVAKKNFKRICKMLIEKKMLYSSDVHMVAMLAEELAIYEEACRELKDADTVITLKSGYKQQNPWLGIRNNAFKHIKDVGALFGFDPLSRQRVTGPAKQPEANPFGQL